MQLEASTLSLFLAFEKLTQLHLENRTFFFDVCNTLFYSNTTFEFLDFHFRVENKKVKKIFLQLIKYPLSPFHIFLKIISILKKKDYFKIQAIKLMKGEKIDDVDDNADRFYLEYLINCKIEPVFDLLENSVKNGNVLLLSSSIEPVVKAISVKLGVEYIATKLATKKNEYTGEIIEDLKGIKESKVLNILKEEYTSFVTDNRSDMNLLSLCDQKYIVTYNNEDKVFWRSLNPIYIEA